MDSGTDIIRTPTPQPPQTISVCRHMLRWRATGANAIPHLMTPPKLRKPIANCYRFQHSTPIVGDGRGSLSGFARIVYQQSYA